MKKEFDEKDQLIYRTRYRSVRPSDARTGQRPFTERPRAKTAAPSRVLLYSLAFLVLGISVLLAGWFSAFKPQEAAVSSSLPAESDVLPSSSVQEAVAPVSSEEEPDDPSETIAAWLNANPDGSTEELLRLLNNNPDALSYICSYPEKKGTLLDCTLTEEDLQVEEGRLLPLFIQWDDRWGYSEYGGYLFGTNACGPTTLSMVATQLLDDPTLNPRAVADLAEEWGYVSPGGGSDWVLMSEGAEFLGLTVEEISPSESWVRSEVEAGHPVVCIMGPGHFTTGGHYIVICGTDGDKFLVNDCNSYTRTNQSWDFDTFKDEIRNLWAFSYNG